MLLAVAPLCEAALYTTDENPEAYLDRHTLRVRLARLLRVSGGMWALEILAALKLQLDGGGVGACDACCDVDAAVLGHRARLAEADALLAGARFMLRLPAGGASDIGPLTWRQLIIECQSNAGVHADATLLLAEGASSNSGAQLALVLQGAAPLPGLWTAAPALRRLAPGGLAHDCLPAAELAPDYAPLWFEAFRAAAAGDLTATAVAMAASGRMLNAAGLFSITCTPTIKLMKLLEASRAYCDCNAGAAARAALVTAGGASLAEYALARYPAEPLVLRLQACSLALFVAPALAASPHVMSLANALASVL